MEECQLNIFLEIIDKISTTDRNFYNVPEGENEKKNFLK